MKVLRFFLIFRKKQDDFRGFAEDSGFLPVFFQRICVNYAEKWLLHENNDTIFRHKSQAATPQIAPTTA